MLLYCKTITPRLRYITEFIGKEISGQPINLSSSIDDFAKYTGTRINYSQDNIPGNSLWIKPHTLLFENGISTQAIDCFTWNGKKAFFKTAGDIPFDILAASFYLLSRYEEYLPHEKDLYGRYAHTNSLAHKEGFLSQPLVNYWLEELKNELKKKFPALLIRKSLFTFLPTYDIDSAWSYLHKEWWRNAGGIIRSMLQGNWKELQQRFQVFAGKQKDPYDAYGWLNQLHEKYNLKPYYFFLVAESHSSYDKNISPRKMAMRRLIHDHAIRYPVGIHPSWRSGDKNTLFKNEIDILRDITGSAIRSSRQHYIRFTLPAGYRQLLAHDISFDFSMGYGSVNGFRASITSPFYWYDLENEAPTGLLVFPFCFMDANSFYEQKSTARQALHEMREYYRKVKDLNGTFIMIWHNSFLGTDPFFAGWRDIYEEFIAGVDL